MAIPSPYDYRGLLREAVEAFENLAGDVGLGLQFESTTDGDVDLAGELVDLVLDVREAEREAGNYERADELGTRSVRSASDRGRAGRGDVPV